MCYKIIVLRKWYEWRSR